MRYKSRGHFVFQNQAAILKYFKNYHDNHLAIWQWDVEKLSPNYGRKVFELLKIKINSENRGCN